MWYQNIHSASFSFVTMHACDRRTDRQTGRLTTPKTALAYACAVKMLYAKIGLQCVCHTCCLPVTCMLLHVVRFSAFVTGRRFDAHPVVCNASITRSWLIAIQRCLYDELTDRQSAFLKCLYSDTRCKAERAACLLRVRGPGTYRIRHV